MKIEAYKIILIGMSGSGKSYYGRKLSELMGWNFFDTDQILENQSSKKIEEILKNDGEIKFRDMEKEIFRSVLRQENMILSTGGGIVERRINRKLLQQQHHVVYLKSSPHLIARRLRKDSTNRPLLNYNELENSIAQLLKKREVWYVQCSTLILEVDFLSEEEVLKKILDFST